MNTLTDESIPNLLINGGFEEETPDKSAPVCWAIRNARATSSIVLSSEDSCPNNLSQLSSGASQANFWTRVTQPQRYPGYRTFLRLVVNSALEPLEAFYDLYDTRLASTIARDTPPLHNYYDYATNTPTPYFNQYRGAPGRAGKPNSGVDLDDRLVTIALSYFVESGEGDIEVFAEADNIGGGSPGIYEFGPDPLASAAQQLIDRVVVSGATPTAEWKRIGKVFRFPAADGTQVFPATVDPVLASDLLKGFTFRLTRTSESGAFVVYLSAVAMVHGAYSDPLGVPYNGDLSYLLDPRNIIRPTFGPLPPPGFRSLSDAIGTTQEFRFPVMGSVDPAPLQLNGEETHTHELSGTKGTTSKKRLPGSGDSGARTGEHAAQHEVTEALNAPPSRSAFLCIKL
jgi:hypothetical protein